MTLFSNPISEAVAGSKSILIAGAGGGFDLYSGIPLYFALKSLGKTVYLANYTFATSSAEWSHQITSVCHRVSAGSPGSESYFPERTLSQWFRENHSIDIDVYTFLPCGVALLRQAYEELLQRLSIDAIILVDGGTDSLLRGDEFGLGTPVEDMTSLVAVNQLQLDVKLLATLGFGVDYFHGVCHADCLRAVAELTKSGGFLGCFTALNHMPEASAFMDLVGYSTERTPSRPSIVCNSIASAIDGEFGDCHRIQRTSGTKLWINPLMNLYWIFRLGNVVDRCLYARAIETTWSQHDVVAAISKFRASVQKRGWDEIPI